MMLEMSQEDAAVLNAIRQVCEGTGFGRVVIEIYGGHIKLIESSTFIRVARNNKNDKIRDESSTEALNPGAV
ncbi:MAG: hypothetical protein KatS3mg047_1064 [Bellilinea sp.]|nr:MAG: hypothetical protein KatS3mg047_1064 [Bellilinea sp.]